MIRKTRGDISQLIPDEAYVRVKVCGVQTEIMYSATHSKGSYARKVSKDSYVVIDKYTGELSDEFEYKTTKTRIENIQSVKDSLRKVRDLINTNCTDISKCKWLTLTYSDSMKDMSKLTFDFKNFHKRCRLRFGHYEYIAVNEPQRNGNWHIHCILIFNHTAPFMDNGEVKFKIWQQGNVDIHNIDNIDNISAYLTNYCQDIEETEISNSEEQHQHNNIQDSDRGINLSDNNPTEKTVDKSIRTESKKYIKKGRLSMYASGSNIYRHSKNIMKPTVYYDTYGNVMKSNVGKMTYKSVINLSNEDSFKNTLIFECYRNDIDKVE